MKTIIVVLLSLILSNAATASFIEKDRLTGGGETLQINLQHPLKNGVGLFAYSLNGQYWGEAYAGLTYTTPNYRYQFAFGAGQETGGHRVGGWIWTGQGKASILHLFEDGTSGKWHRTELFYDVTPKVTLGAVDRSYMGKGGIVQYSLDAKTKIKFSVFPKTTEVAIKVSF